MKSAVDSSNKGAQRADKPEERTPKEKPSTAGRTKVYLTVGDHASAKYPGVQMSDNAEDSHDLPVNNPDKYHSGHDAICDEHGYILLKG